MKRRNAILGGLFLAVLFLALLGILVLGFLPSRQEMKFDKEAWLRHEHRAEMVDDLSRKLTPGMSREAILEMLGPPDTYTKYTNSPNELRYQTPEEEESGAYFVIELDSNNKYVGSRRALP